MKKGLIFDMDGTLWDSSVQVAKSWDIAIAECGYKRAPITEEDMQSVMGKTMDVIAQILFADVEADRQKELLDACCKAENEYLRQHGGVLYPMLRKTLTKLKEKYHLYIVSNCQSGYIEAFLDYYQMWDLFEDIECYGNNLKQKSENIALVVKRNGLTQAAYVGDIQGDYDATMQAGIAFIHAKYGFGTIQETVPVIHSFAELIEVAEQVLGA